MNYVFVYGTLLRGEGNHHLIEDQQFVGEATLENFLMRSAGSFPYIVPVVPSTETAVKGEVYKVSARGLNRLDLLEGVPHMYTRITVEVTMDGNPVKAAVKAAVYMGNSILKQNGPIIENGDWKARLEERVAV